MQTTNIEWCDATINPWWGCTKVSPGCAHCYADSLSKRYGKDVWGKGKPRENHLPGAAKLANKLNLQSKNGNFRECHCGHRAFRKMADGGPTPFTLMPCEKCGDTGRKSRQARPRVFCASMADWLDEEVPAQWLSDLLYLIAKSSHLDWLLLTKRPQLWKQRMQDVVELDDCGSQVAWRWLRGSAPAHVWIGTTVEDQQRANERIPELLKIPAKVRFLSCEPLLEPVHLSLPFASIAVHASLRQDIHWVIAGGESGPGCRPFGVEWARYLRDQCACNDVAFFMKQMGGTRKPFPPIPDDLMTREFPFLKQSITH